MSGDSEARQARGAAGDLVCLVMAMLAVGGYSIQRVRHMQSALASEGLFDPEVVGTLSEAQVVRRLATSGYDRGPIVTSSMANRLIALHAAVRDGVLMQASRLMQQGRLKDAEKTLSRVKGIGPTVFKQFTILRGVEDET